MSPFLVAVWRVGLGIFFVAAGLNHFLNPEIYLSMMPPYLPAHGILVAISGGAEILGGVAVFIPPLRRVAGWGLIALLIAVFPANVHVALHGWPGADFPRWVLWFRLPFQLLMIAWVHQCCLAGPARVEPARDSGKVQRF